MMFIASLIELPIAKTQIWQKTQDPLSEFRQGRFACYLVSLGPLLGCRRKVEVQEKTIAELKSGMTALAATVKEQASQKTRGTPSEIGLPLAINFLLNKLGRFA
jgi:hypothetical protein